MTLDAKAVHTFDEAPERVFDAFLDPLMIGKWMFGPAVRNEKIVSIEIDPKVGGEFSFLVSRQNTVIDHVGTYLVINRPRHLEFKWGVKGMSDSSKVSVKMEPEGSGCVVTLVHELHPDWAEYFERTQAGWAMMLGLLDKALKN